MRKKIPGKYKGQPRNYYHYMCSAYMRSGGEICTKHSIKNDELEKAVLESVKVQIGLIIDMKRIKGSLSPIGIFGSNLLLLDIISVILLTESCSIWLLLYVIIPYFVFLTNVSSDLEISSIFS